MVTRTPGPDPSGPAAVFIAPHQDDEVLSMGAAILEHVAAGRDVLVLLIGRGNKSIVRTRDLPPRLGYTPTEEEFGAVRDAEFTWSVERLGAIAIIPPYAERFDERAMAPAAVAALIRGYTPVGSDLKTLTDVADFNPDHAACHDAVASLYAGGWTPYEPRYYTLCGRRAAAWRAGYRTLREGVNSSTPITSEHQEPYRYWNPDERRWSVGYLSVPYWFDDQVIDPFAYRVVPRVDSIL